MFGRYLMSEKMTEVQLGKRAMCLQRAQINVLAVVGIGILRGRLHARSKILHLDQSVLRTK